MNIDLSLLVSALSLVVKVSIPVLLAVLGGAVVAGVVRVVTQIDDQVIGYIGRLSGLALLLYFGTQSVFGEVIDFTGALWGSVTYYQ